MIPEQNVKKSYYQHYRKLAESTLFQQRHCDNHYIIDLNKTEVNVIISYY